MASHTVPAVGEFLPRDALAWVEEIISTAWTTFKPGGRLHPQTFIESKGHLVVEAILLALISYLLFQGRQKPQRRKERPLSKEVGTRPGRGCCDSGSLQRCSLG